MSVVAFYGVLGVIIIHIPIIMVLQLNHLVNYKFQLQLRLITELHDKEKDNKV